MVLQRVKFGQKDCSPDLSLLKEQKEGQHDLEKVSEFLVTLVMAGLLPGASGFM